VSTRRKLTIAVLALPLLMLTLHLLINGLPDLSSFNPHNR
jgi:hypothetical protein